MAQYRLLNPDGELVNIIEWNGSSDLGLAEGWETQPFTGFTDEERAALEDDQRLAEVEALDRVTLRGLFNHENRLRALVRGIRATSTATQRTTLDNQGVEPARQDMTLDDFKSAIKALL